MDNTVVIALITGIGGASVGGSFALVQAIIKAKLEKKIHDDNRADKKDERFDQLRTEFQAGLDEREAPGKRRFDINSKQIEENTIAIKRLIELNEEQANKIDKFADSVTKSFDVMSTGVRSILYDKITVVYDKCLNRCTGGAITSEEMANMEQLYLSYSGNGGNGEGKEMYKTACNMKRVTKAEADKLDAERLTKFA